MCISVSVQELDLKIELLNKSISQMVERGFFFISSDPTMFPEVEVIRIDFECITAIEMDYVRVGSIAFCILYQRLYYITKSYENGTKN